MGNIASPWRYDAAASHARAPLKHPIAYDLALRPRAAIFQCHGRLGWALIHPRNRVYVGCRRKPGGQISAPSRLLLTRNGQSEPTRQLPILAAVAAVRARHTLGRDSRTDNARPALRQIAPRRA